MRILYCIPTLGGGGAERQVRLITAEFAKRGVEIGVMARFSPIDLDALQAAGVHCIPLDAKGNHSPGLAWSVMTETRSSRWPIVQSWLTQMDVLVGIASRASKTRWILSERSSAAHYAQGWKNALRRRLGSRADYIIANSAKGLEYWQGEPTRKAIIPNAVDLEAIVARCDDRVQEKGRSTPSIVSVGRLDQWKNFGALIRSQAALRRRGVMARLAILGDGPLRAELNALITDLDLHDRVSLEGFATDIVEWLRRSDLYVSTSLYEGQPNAVLEAAAANVPLVLSDIAAHRELFGDEAILVDRQDPEAIADGISQLLGDRVQARRNAAAAFAKVERQSIESIATRYLECYADLI
ncbi:MAG TPA: glycosyltransferase [Nitrobacter sp.]|nr:glycosyltransferase [Nitrobacter sp.]